MFILFSSFRLPNSDKPPLERQNAIDSTHCAIERLPCAIESTNLLSPSTVLQSSSSSRRSSSSRSPNSTTKSVTIHTASQKSQAFTFPDQESSPPASRRPSVSTRGPSTSRRPSVWHQNIPKIQKVESSHIGSNVRTKRSQPNSTISGESSGTKVKEKVKDWKEKQNEEEEGVDVIPIVGGVLIASVLGLPVVLIAGLKLGMFAAIGGGAMGYTTGKMFSDHGYSDRFIKYKIIVRYSREREEMIKGEYAAAVGGKATSKDRRKRRMLRRIHEYEKFVDNCQRYKQYERMKKEKVRERRHTLAVVGNWVQKEALPRRSRSMESFNKERETWTDRYSVPLLPDYDYKISLNERILLWQSQSVEEVFLKESLSINSLPIIVAEIENEKKDKRKLKRRSKSIDSWLLT